MPKLREPELIITPDEPKNESVRVVIDQSWPSVRTIVRIVLVTLLLLFIANRVETIIAALTYLFFLLILSIFFAYLIDPLVKLIRRPFKARGIERFMPRSVAIVAAYLIVFSTVAAAISILAPLVVDQAREFAANVPSYATTVRERASELNRSFDRLRLPDQLETKINEKVVEGLDAITTFITAVILGGFVLNLVTYSPWLFLVPILAFFFLKDVNLIRLTILRTFPAGRWRMRAEAVLQDVNTTLAAYTRAQIISCLLIGAVCTLVFYLLGLKYALLLGIMAGIFEFVPLIGPLAIGLIATSTAAFSDNPWRALYVAIFLIVLRIFHDYYTYPKIVRGGIHLHPLMIILSVLAGEQIAGIPGVFLAIPIVALITVIYRHVLEHHGSRGLFDGLIEPEQKPQEETPA